MQGWGQEDSLRIQPWTAPFNGAPAHPRASSDANRSASSGVVAL
jgi:hypothetical protein